GSQIDPANTTFSFHHNLMANLLRGSPWLTDASTADLRNNLNYNWKGQSGANWGTGTTDVGGNKSAFGNHINNIYKPGPSTTGPGFMWLENGGPTRPDGIAADRGGTHIFTDGNWGPNCPTGCANDWSNGYYTMFDYAPGPLATESQFRVFAPFPVPP